MMDGSYCTFLFPAASQWAKTTIRSSTKLMGHRCTKKIHINLVYVLVILNDVSEGKPTALTYYQGGHFLTRLAQMHEVESVELHRFGTRNNI